jgi:hypothetical protein
LTQTLLNFNPTIFTKSIIDFKTTTNLELANTNKLLTDGFSSLASLSNILSNGSGTQLQIIEENKSLAAAVSSGFLNIKLPCNLITDSLLRPAEKQYSTYLDHMTSQMAAESNNIFQDIFNKMEKQTMVAWSAHMKIMESADSINQSNFKIVNKIVETSEVIINHTDSSIVEATECLTRTIQSKTDLILEVDSKSARILEVDSKILELFQKQQLLIKENNEILDDRLNKLLNEITEI